MSALGSAHGASVDEVETPQRRCGIPATPVRAAPDGGGRAHPQTRSVQNRRRRLRVLIAGGGVAALEAALALRDLAADRVDVELLAPEPQFWYRPLAVVEPFGTGHVHGVELASLARSCGAHFTLDALASVDSDRHLARTAAGAEIEYDV